MDTQKADRHAFFPILAEQRANFSENLGVELSWGSKRVSAGKRGEVLVTQFELDGARVKLRFAQAASHHFREAHQRGFELARVRSVFVVGVLVADGFCIGIGSDFGIEPAAGVLSTSLAGKSQTPFPEAVV